MVVVTTTAIAAVIPAMVATAIPAITAIVTPLPVTVVAIAAIPMAMATPVTAVIVIVVNHTPRQPEHHPQQQYDKTTHDRLLYSRYPAYWDSQSPQEFKAGTLNSIV